MVTHRDFSGAEPQGLERFIPVRADEHESPYQKLRLSREWVRGRGGAERRADHLAAIRTR